MSREALVVGINSYQHLSPLNASAGDAEAIAQFLERQGDFRVRRLPQFQDPFEHNAQRVARSQGVSLVQLEEALVQLFKPDSRSIPDTAVFFFSGHGLRKQRGIQEGFLATSDSQADQGFFGLSLQWLRRLLQESDVRQQVIWLDCCHSGELLQFEEADPGDRGKGRDRCFIAASRSHQSAYESTAEHHSLLTQALLDGLNPNRFPERGIDNLLLTDYINQALRGTLQSPVCTNSGESIRLCYRQTVMPPATADPREKAGDRCPYKGLAYFDCNDDDPQYFFGRTALVDSLLDQVRCTSFLALLGASGSGKSSVLRAGLLHQLTLGQRLSGSDRWRLHVLTPGAHPLQNLALALLDPTLSGIDRATQLNQIESLLSQGGKGMRQIAQSCGAPRLVIVVDQLEEVFTLCQNPDERDAFFACLLEPLGAPTEGSGRSDDYPLLVLLALRSDFFGACMEKPYSGLGDRLRHHLVPIPPMNRDELRDAMVQPAKQVRLEIEPELVATMLMDVEGAPGHLPLLQYTLTELWKHRQDNSLTLYSYTRLGGILGTLRKRADAVYAAFAPQEKEAARDIFLALTQINQDMEDTRRRVAKADLVTPRHPADVVNRVLQQLTAEQLVVTSELVTKGDESRIAMVEVAHEALIRHWPQLRAWIEENHDLLRMRQKLETKAEEWRSHKQSSDYLLRGRPLREAQTFQKTHGKIFPLSNDAQQFVKKSRSQRTRTRLLQAGVGVVALVAAVPMVLPMLYWAIAPLVFRQQGRQMLTSFQFHPNQSSVILVDGLGTVRKWDEQTEDLETLLATNSTWRGGRSPYFFASTLQLSKDGSVVATSELDSVRYLQANQPEVLLQDEVGKAQAEAMGIPGGSSLIIDLALSPEGDLVSFQNNFNGIYLWNPSRDRLTPLLEETRTINYSQVNTPTLAFSPDGETLGAIAKNSLHLWTRDGTPINNQPPTLAPANPSFQAGLTYLAFSPDGQRIATSMQGAITLWDMEGQRIATLSLPDIDTDTTASTPGYAGVSNVPLSLFAFSPDGRQIATVTNNMLSLWEADTGTLITTVADNEASDTSLEHAYIPLQPSHLRFSPDGSILVQRKDEEIIFWSATGDEIAVLPMVTAVSGAPNPVSLFNNVPRFTSFDFHPTEAQFVTSQVDGTVKLWSFQGEELGILQTAMASPEAPPSSNPLNPRSWRPNFQGTYGVQFRSDGEAIAILNVGSLRLVTPDGMEILDIQPNGRPIP